jgi:dTMP kinase
VIRGRFITFEGLDGAGKSTHIDAVKSAIETRGFATVGTREPGGTPLAEILRGLILAEQMDPLTETLLVFAARQNHLSEVIAPALDRGHWVVCDRFTDASFAYQGGGRGVPNARIDALEQWVHADLQPDLTLLFDVPFEVAHGRIGSTRQLDRVEREAAEFLERVRRAYLQRAAAAVERIVVIDAAQSPEVVRARVLAALDRLFS